MKEFNHTGDITDKTFGFLTGVRESGRSKWGDVVWLFKCDCGVEKELVAAIVKRGEISHCGCRFVSYNKTHGMCRTKEYNTWCRIIQDATIQSNQNTHDTVGEA